MNLLDRALLRRFPDVPPSLSTFSSTKQDENSPLSCSASVVPSPPGGVTKETTKKRKRFIGKENAKKATTSPEPRDSLQKQEQSDTPCGFTPKVAVSIVPSTSLSSPSVPDTVPPDFALLYYRLVKDKALPIGHLPQFLSLEIPARRAAKKVASFSSLNFRFYGFYSSI